MEYLAIRTNFISTPNFVTLLQTRRLKFPSVCSIIRCVPQNCESSTCFNRERPSWDMKYMQELEKFQESPLLKVESTSHGTCVFSTGAITKGSNIVEYCGELVPIEIFQQRVSTSYSELAHVYGVPIWESIVIDATKMGNISRHINFSSDHNANMHMAYETNGFPRAIIYVTRDILPLEEIKLPLLLNGVIVKQFCSNHSCEPNLQRRKAGNQTATTSEPVEEQGRNSADEDRASRASKAMMERKPPSFPPSGCQPSSLQTDSVGDPIPGPSIATGKTGKRKRHEDQQKGKKATKGVEKDRI